MRYEFNKDFAGQAIIAALAKPFNDKTELHLESATEEELKFYYNEVANKSTKFVIESEKLNQVSEIDKNVSDEESTNTSERPEKKRRKRNKKA